MIDLFRWFVADYLARGRGEIRPRDQEGILYVCRAERFCSVSIYTIVSRHSVLRIYPGQFRH